MRRELWLPERGWFAEWKDLLGLQRVHPTRRVWTFYHAIGLRGADALEAWQMSRFVDTQIAHIPVHGDGVPGATYTLPTTGWMPYTWSINNVVMAETVHTSLAYWQAGRRRGVPPVQGRLLDSMFLGFCPGNVGDETHFDMARGEAHAISPMPVGVLSRTLVEGLFGVRRTRSPRAGGPPRLPGRVGARAAPPSASGSRSRARATSTATASRRASRPRRPYASRSGPP